MSSEFNFFQQWYPLSPLEDLAETIPTPVTLLGMRLVIWKSPCATEYGVFLDQCPHRLAPLSEGRIDEKTGNLMCSYHGWEFNPQGYCTQIPQAENPDILTKQADDFCAVVFPTRQAQDLLWVWADPHSVELAQNTPLPLSPQIDATKGFVWSTFVRDLAYDWQTLVENVVDPSHVPFAHHGVQGKRDNAAPIAFKLTQSTPTLIEAEIDRKLSVTITFEPPCRLEYAFQAEDRKFGLLTYCIPVSPGKSRIVALFPRNFAKMLHNLVPRWWNHVSLRNLVLDGDMILLHQQERVFHQKLQHQSWKTAYKLPTNADRLVIEFRKWFDTYCQGNIPWKGNNVTDLAQLPLESDRQQILDRYHQHTQQCHSCRGALRTLQRLKIALLGFWVIALTITAMLPDFWRIRIGLPLLGGALVGLGVYCGIKFWLEPKFYFVDYIHAQRL